MKSFHMTLGAGLDGLVAREHDIPAPAAGEVLVRVHAVSLNYRELSILQLGRYPLPVKPDVIGMCDGAGEVVALGPGVRRWRVGDRVVASIFPYWIDGPFGLDRAAQLGGSLDGMLTEYAALPESALVAVPAHLSFEQAATLPCAAVTAWNALTGGQPLQAGDDVLVLGSGGVSLFALQLAKAFGARVIATTSSDEKAQRLRALGADEVVDYVRTPDWSVEVRRLTGGVGVRRIVETGGAATLPQSLKSIAFSGEIGFVGSVAGGAEPIDANTIFAAGATLRAVAAGSRSQLERVAATMTVGRIEPVIDRSFAFDDAPAALAHYAQGRNFGKIVIRVSA